MFADLAALVALQELDTAAETARRRLAELPGAEEAILAQVAAAQATVDEAKSRVAANAHDRRELEKQVAGVDARLSKFDSHKAAVKTNHEYTALLHEIATAKAEKDAIEEQILMLMDAGDGVAAEVKAAEAALGAVKKQGDVTRAGLSAERTALEGEVTRLSGQKTTAAGGVDPATLARYEQLLKQRRLIAVAAIIGEMCAACHVRLRPAVTQRVRRNVELITCDSCKRILYFPETPAPAATETAAGSQG